MNPRFPSSAEVIEHGYGVMFCPPLQHRLFQALYQAIVMRLWELALARQFCFRESVTVAEPLHLSVNDNHEDTTSPALADIPHTGTHIKRGHPIVTLLRTGPLTKLRLVSRLALQSSKISCMLKH